jgi:hypothetical protein
MQGLAWAHLHQFSTSECVTVLVFTGPVLPGHRSEWGTKQMEDLTTFQLPENHEDSGVPIARLVTRMIVWYPYHRLSALQWANAIPISIPSQITPVFHLPPWYHSHCTAYLNQKQGPAPSSCTPVPSNSGQDTARDDGQRRQEMYSMPQHETLYYSSPTSDTVHKRKQNSISLVLRA